MKQSLLAHLRCPEDGSPLQLEIAEMDDREIKSGFLRSATGRVYPIRDYIPRFVDADKYTSTFTRQRRLERQHLDQREVDAQDEAELLVKSTGFDLSRLDGLTLDAGCGFGRFLRVIDSIGHGEVIGVDLSTGSVEFAFEFAGRGERVHIVQADLGKLPFPRRHFRRAFSVGVLHHTPDTRASFERLLPYLEEGGDIAIWVYAPEYKIASDVWRKLTTKLPLSLVYAWCIANEVLFAAVRSLPRGGGRFGTIVPGGSLGTPFWMRVMSDFDDLTPRYAHTHTASEVKGWFSASGLTDVEALSRPTAVRGRMPAVPPSPRTVPDERA
jgi:SAM-dependent methyltransferase